MRPIPMLTGCALAALTLASAAQGRSGFPGQTDWSDDPPVLASLVAFADQESNLRTAVVRYLQDRAAIERRYPILYSPARAARLHAFHDAWRARLAETDFAALNPEGQVDYVTLRNRIDHDQAMLRLSETRAAQIAPLLPFFDRLRAFQEARFDRTRVNAREAAGVLDGVAGEVEGLSAALADGRKPSGVSAVAGRRAALQVEHLRTVLDDYNRFYDGYDPDYSWWVRKPYQRLDAALEAYAGALNLHLAGIRPGEQPPIIGDPVLAQGLAADLALEMIPYSVAELIRIGEREFAWIVRELKIVSNRMGHGDDWHAALEHVKTLAPAPGEVPWAIFDIADYSERFVEKDGSVTMPALSREVWRLAMQTPERQLINPFFSGGEVTRLSYPVDSMSHAHKLMSMRGNTPHFNFATVHHELIPGHHMQKFMNDRFNTHRTPLTNTPVWREGWALYWEMILWEKDFPRNDADRIGMLFWRLHRAARIVFSLNYQTGAWTPQQAVDYLVQQVGHERANAEAEVRRTTIDAPFYQAAYMIGGLQFHALRRELVDSGRMTERGFHDAVMQLGPMPVELIRARLLDQPLQPDYRSRWRFYSGPVN
ncbi:DUF885 domain-containing protein [Sandaracinobacter sp. RS1-74]|uniref:DUF885 family protein n=1 Tax=Sandaracinobacteroides sayramensis TaxID=2913411 RepID=UPI001EDC1ED7|nr:DUF885 family protein [Sandaracinobacteroides sayramensis]MCG2840141.1 DUF885 domain-containing protein [Sandaracinobacteroides sayramensis]